MLSIVSLENPRLKPSCHSDLGWQRKIFPSRCHWSWCKARQGGASLLPPPSQLPALYPVILIFYHSHLTPPHHHHIQRQRRGIATANTGNIKLLQVSLSGQRRTTSSWQPVEHYKFFTFSILNIYYKLSGWMRSFQDTDTQYFIRRSWTTDYDENDSQDRKLLSDILLDLY